MSEYIGQLWAPLSQAVALAQGAAGGNLPALLAQLESGLAGHVGPWVGRDRSVPLTVEELERTFSPEQLNSWAEQAGTTPEALLQAMAQPAPGIPLEGVPALPGGALPP